MRNCWLINGDTEHDARYVRRYDIRALRYEVFVFRPYCSFTLLPKFVHLIFVYFNSSIERVEGFKYLGTTLTNQNSIQEEIKCRLKLGNACSYSMQNLLSSSLLSKTLKIKIYRTIILPVVLYGCETWSLTLREERKLRVFENWVLRRVFVPKRDEVKG